MSEEESTQLCTKSKLSQDETEASNDRQSKKHKNDTSDSFDSDVFETNKKDKLRELHEKIDEMNVSMRDNDNTDVQKITTIFGNLRKIIDEYENTLKTEVREIEQQKKPSTVEYMTLTEKITQFLRTKDDDPSMEKIDKLTNDIELFKQQIIELKTTTKLDYSIDEIDNLETKVKSVLGHTCVTEFRIPNVYGGRSCEGRACKTCGKCRDWYYIGDQSTWQWIINDNEWDEEDRKRWDDGNYKNRFQRRKGSTCKAHFGYYYDRNHDYYGGHITRYMDCECGEGYDTYFIRHGRDGCGYRFRYIADNYPYCQCEENVKEI